jgi:hypothetical protein
MLRLWSLKRLQNIDGSLPVVGCARFNPPVDWFSNSSRPQPTRSSRSVPFLAAQHAGPVLPSEAGSALELLSTVDFFSRILFTYNPRHGPTNFPANFNRRRHRCHNRQLKLGRRNPSYQ